MCVCVCVCVCALADNTLACKRPYYACCRNAVEHGSVCTLYVSRCLVSPGILIGLDNTACVHLMQLSWTKVSLTEVYNSRISSKRQ